MIENDSNGNVARTSARARAIAGAGATAGATAKGLFVTGTDTGVGKTCVCAALASAMRRRLPIRTDANFDSSNRSTVGKPPRMDGPAQNAVDSREAADVRLWKPVQTGTRIGSPEADSYRLRLAGESGQPEADIASLTFADPLAPWMAARRAACKIDYEALASEGRKRLDEAEFLVVEGAGGIAVPLTERKLIAHLAADLGLPILIVARAGLGTVNHTLLTIAFARGMGIPVAGVLLNGASATAPEERIAVAENAEMIETFGGVPVLGALPWIGEAGGIPEPARLRDALETSVNWNLLSAALGWQDGNSEEN